MSKRIDMILGTNVYHTAQLLCIKWGPDPPEERWNSPTGGRWSWKVFDSGRHGRLSRQSLHLSLFIELVTGRNIMCSVVWCDVIYCRSRWKCAATAGWPASLQFHSEMW